MTEHSRYRYTWLHALTHAAHRHIYTAWGNNQGCRVFPDACYLVAITGRQLLSLDTWHPCVTLPCCILIVSCGVVPCVAWPCWCCLPLWYTPDFGSTADVCPSCITPPGVMDMPQMRQADVSSHVKYVSLQTTGHFTSACLCMQSTVAVSDRCSCCPVISASPSVANSPVSLISWHGLSRQLRRSA